MMVRFQVADPAGNVSNCMVNAQIKDVGLPDVTCPDDLTINCQADLSDLSASYGDAQLLGNCGADFPVSESQEDDRNVCGLGDLTRVFTFTDQDGVVLGTCSQTLTIENVTTFDPDDVIWPEDFTAQCSTDLEALNPDNLAANIGNPILPEGCYLFGVDYEDDYFTSATDEELCGKIVRKWTLIDWCNGTDGDFDTYQYSQLILIENNTPPTLVAQDDLQFYSTAALCDSVDVNVTRSAEDDCSPVAELMWSYLLTTADGTQYQGNGSNLNTRLPLGSHQVLWTVEDDCGNRRSELQLLVLSSNVPATPLCVSSISIALEEAWQNVKLPNSLLDGGTTHPCGEAYVLSFDLSLIHI